MLLQHHLVFPVTLAFHASIPQCANHCLLALHGAQNKGSQQPPGFEETDGRAETQKVLLRRQLNMAAGVTPTNAPPCILKPWRPLSQFRTVTHPFPNQPKLNGLKSSRPQEHTLLDQHLLLFF